MNLPAAPGNRGWLHAARSIPTVEWLTYLLIFLLLAKNDDGWPTILVTIGLSVALLMYRTQARIPGTPLAVMFALYVGLTFLLLPLSAEPLYSFREAAARILPGAVLFCAVSAIGADACRLRRLFFALAFVNVYLLAGAYGRSIEKLLTHAYAPNDPYGLAVKPGFNLNIFGIYVTTFLPLLGFVALREKPGRLRNGIAVLILAGVGAAILSLSRAGWAALVCMGLMGTIFLVRKWKQVGIGLRVFVAMAMFIVVMTSAFAPVRGMISRTPGEFGDLHFRTYLWKDTMKAVCERPWFGWGLGQDIFSNVVSGAEAHPSVQGAQDAHNSFLHVLFHQGAAGLLAYISLLGVCILAAMRGIAGRNGDMLQAGWLAVLSVVLADFVVAAIVHVTPFFLVGLVLGIASAFQASARAAGREKSCPDPEAPAR